MDKMPSQIPNFHFDGGSPDKSGYKDSALDRGLSNVKGKKNPPVTNIKNGKDEERTDNQIQSIPNQREDVFTIHKCGNVDKPLGVLDVFSALVEHFKKVDFTLLIGKSDEESIREYEYHSAITKAVIATAEKEGYRFAKVKDSDLVYLFNSRYWEQVSEDYLNNFLKECAERMGIAELKAMCPRFRNSLHETFVKNIILFPDLPESESIKINLLSGTFEINARKNETQFQPFSPDDYLTYQLPFDYAPDATCPIWQKHLDKVLPDKSAQLVLAEFIASAFIPVTVLKLEKMLMLYGQGANGKSVIYNVITALFSERNVSQCSISELTQSTGYYRVMIKDKLLNYSSELGAEFESAIFKQMVSGEEITARSPHEKPITFRCKTKFIVNANIFPRIKEHTDALFRRFIIIPFDVQIPESEQIKDLDTQIISSELSGVFNWVLEGLHRLLNQKGFTDCTASKKMLEKFRKDSDTVLLFLDDNHYVKSDKEFVALKDGIFTDYMNYCNQVGIRHPSGLHRFSERLRNLGFIIKRRNKSNVVYISTMIPPDDDAE